jgi:multiple sugar transport system ATP-binding protein
VAAGRPALERYSGRTIALGIRPEQLEDGSLARDGERPRLRGRVLVAETLGSEVLAHVELPGKPVVTDGVPEVPDDVQEPYATFVGRFDAGSEVRPDHVVEMTVDTTRLHFFDLETGLAIRDSTGAS